MIAERAASSPEILHPFPGLRSFTQDEAHLFFGREGQSDEILRRLEQIGFVAVVGPSGCGKSSLVRAGLLPALLAGYADAAGSSWQIVDFHPGGDPLGNLAAAFSDAVAPLDAPALRAASAAVVQAVAAARRDGRLAADANVLLLVDQFEELFRYRARPESDTADRDEKARFVSLLLEAARDRAQRIFVVLTLRAEFLGDCAQFRNLPEAINRSQYLVPRMTRLERRAAIEGPVHMAGAEIAPHLVQRLLNDLGEDPDQLPVLQNALLRIWAAWVALGTPEREIEFEHYKAVGTTEEGTTSLRAALDRHAEEALDEVKKRLGPAAESLVKGIFLRLRGRDDRGRETRTPATVADLCAVTGADLEAVRTAVDCFRDDAAGRTFLTPFKSRVAKVEPTDEIDITHEALLRCWTKLKDVWVPEEEESRRLYVALAERAEKDPSHQDLLRGRPFERVSEWWQKRQPNAAWAARYNPGFAAAERYLSASRKSYDRRRWLSQSATWLAVALVSGLSVLVSYFLTVRQGREEAVANLLASRAALALGEDGAGPATGLLLAAESLKRRPTPEAQAVAIQALSLLPPPLASLPAKEAREVAFGAKGTRLAYLESDGVVRIWDPPGKSLQAPAALVTGVRTFAFARQAAFLAAIRESGSLVVLDTASGREVAHFDCPAKGAAVAISANGLVVAALCGGKLHLWTAALSWAEAKVLPVNPPEGVWDRLALDDSGATLALARIGTAMLESQFSIGSGIEVISLTGKWRIIHLPIFEHIQAMTFLPSIRGGISLVFGGESGKVQLWSQAPADKEGEPRVLLKHSATITALATDADGTNLIVGYQNGMVRVWNLEDDREEARLVGTGRLLSVALRDGQAWSVGQDLSLQAWDLGKGEDAIPLGNVASAKFFRDFSKLFFLAEKDKKISYSVLDVSHRTVVGSWSPKYGQYPDAISPDGASVAVASNSELTLRELSADGIAGSRWRQPAPVQGVQGLTFSPDGRHLAGVAGRLLGGDPPQRTGLFVWSTATGAEEIYSPEEPAYAPARRFWFTPDSRRILFVSQNGRIKDLSLAAGGRDEKPLAMAPDSNVTALAFSPNGSLLATATFDRASAGEGGQSRARITVRSFPAGQEIASFEQAISVRDLAFSPDSQSLLSAGYDDATVIWSLEKKQQEAKFPSSQEILAVAFTSKDQVAVVDESQLVFHSWKPADLIAEACRRVQHNLTPEQWQRSVPGEEYKKTCRELP